MFTESLHKKEMNIMKFCPQCGAELTTGAGFCASCGANINNKGSDASSTEQVAAESELANLYSAAHRAKASANVDQAFKYYEQIAMKDPHNWEPTFYVPLLQAMQGLRDGEFNSSIMLVGNCIKVTFDLIEDIEDYDEQNHAAKDVAGNIEAFVEGMGQAVKRDWKNDKDELFAYHKAIDAGVFKQNADHKEIDKRWDARKEALDDIVGMLKQRQTRLHEVVGKRRFEEFWAENQPLKAELESEKSGLKEQISELEKEISEMPPKIEGYQNMLELQKQVANLTSEKKALGLLKLKEKKAVQVKIDAVNAQIAPIQGRIDAAIAEVQKRIAPLTNRVQAIDHELTKPR